MRSLRKPSYTTVAVTKSGRGAEGLSRLPRERCGAVVGSREASLGDRARVPFGDALSVFEGVCVFWNVNGHLSPILPTCIASTAAGLAPEDAAGGVPPQRPPARPRSRVSYGIRTITYRIGRVRRRAVPRSFMAGSSKRITEIRIHRPGWAGPHMPQAGATVAEQMRPGARDRRRSRDSSSRPHPRRRSRGRARNGAP